MYSYTCVVCVCICIIFILYKCIHNSLCTSVCLHVYLFVCMHVCTYVEQVASTLAGPGAASSRWPRSCRRRRRRQRGRSPSGPGCRCQSSELSYRISARAQPTCAGSHPSGSPRSSRGLGKDAVVHNDRDLPLLSMSLSTSVVGDLEKP